MAELFVEFEEAVASGGLMYRAQACGAKAGNVWEGWIEFIPIDGGQPVRSGRETTQPNREDTAYWATGLTHVYLEGALKRALNPLVRTVVPPPPASIFDGPALRVTVASPVRPHEAVLNPFSVAEKGEGLLRQELSALSSWHLVNIIAAYDLSQQPVAAINRLPSSRLVDIIVEGVRARTASARAGHV